MNEGGGDSWRCNDHREGREEGWAFIGRWGIGYLSLQIDGFVVVEGFGSECCFV